MNIIRICNMRIIHVKSIAMAIEADLIWNEPTQARSRQKVERLLDAALALAVEQGSLDIKVTEVAKRAGVAIGTLYQFFPTRTALIAKLFAREMKPIDEAVGKALVDAKTFQALRSQIEAELKATLDLVRSRPGLSVVWSSTSLDPAIGAADFANTQQNAKTLAALMASFLPDKTDPERIHATALLICHLWGSVVRLCILTGPEDEDVLLREYASMLAAHGRSLAEAGS